MSYTILGTLFALVAGGLFVTPYWAPPDDTALDLTNEAFVLVDRETIPDFGVQNEEFEVIKEEVLHFQDDNSEISQKEKSFTSEFRAPERPRWFQQNRLRRAENAPHDDPRYASPVEELVCLKNKQKNFFESTVKSIGCCPEGDPEGKPFGAGRACCCGKIFDEQNQFCCEETCEVMLAVPKQKKQCKKSKNKENQRIIETTPETTTTSSKAMTTTKGESVPATFTTFTTEDSVQECPKLWEKKPKAMQKECDQLGSGVETCSISCPEGTRVNGSESLLCIGKLHDFWH